MTRYVIYVICAISIAAAVGCSSQKDAVKQRDSKGFGDEPEWALNVPAGCGLGIVEYRGNRGLVRSSATARARDDLARQLQTRVQGMIKDYASQGEAKGEEYTEEQLTQVSRQLVEQTLAGTQVAGTYVSDDKNRNYYSLVCMNPEAYKAAIDGMEVLSDGLRRQLEQRADEEFADMDRHLGNE